MAPKMARQKIPFSPHDYEKRKSESTEIVLEKDCHFYQIFVFDKITFFDRSFSFSTETLIFDQILMLEVQTS